MRGIIVVGVAVLGACGLTSNVVQCEDGRTCPEATVCADQFELCVLPEQVTQCAAQPDRTQCDVLGALGSCHDGVCLEAVCGNNRSDLEMTTACAVSPCLPYEVCDDGNNLDGDGCSGNCLSEEACGNLLVDAVNGETCDDGNLLDHDSCSSACQTEAVRWVRVRDPGPLTQMRAVYDAARNKVVMFGGRVVDGIALANRTNAVAEWDGIWRSNIFAPGPLPIGPDGVADPTSSFGMAYDGHRAISWIAGGVSNGAPIQDTWGWDGARWIRGPNLPFPLSDHSMAYDAKRQRVVVFGGQYEEDGSDVYSGDTYELVFDANGSRWIKAAPAASPAPRRYAGMTYDPRRGVMVMFGGFGNDASLDFELWEYDGVTWTKRLDNTNGGPGIIGAAMAYDAVNGVIVIYGSGQMWTWNGSQLTQFTGPLPTANASPRSGAVLVPDGNRRLMLYGGHSGGSGAPRLTTGLMWFYDGSVWTQAQTPPPVGGAGMVNLTDRGSVVRFGGSSLFQGAATSETWELNSRGWTRFSTGNPSAMTLTQLAFDDSRQQLLAFGGTPDSGGTVALNETWTRSGPIWTFRPPTGTWPAARAFHSLVHDRVRHETLLFGGIATDQTPLGDTWVWNGATWLQRTPVNSPEARAGAAMGFDAAAGVVVLFSGLSGVNKADTWIWDGTNWHDVTVAGAESPTLLGGATLTWNPARRCLVLSGGLFTSVLETWEWRTTTTSPYAGVWSRVPTAEAPGPRLLAPSFSTLDGSGITVFQGSGIDEVWELRYDGPAPQDACVVPHDSDGDGLAGCDDPDCWRACSPVCPPGTSCGGMDVRCGDNVCGLVENCRICPQDCTICGDTRCGDFVCDPNEVCPGDCP